MSWRGLAKREKVADLGDHGHRDDLLCASNPTNVVAFMGLVSYA
jgi:hypothetical protein